MIPPLAVVLNDTPARSLCSLFVRELDVSGASLGVVGLPGRQSTVCVSDRRAAARALRVGAIFAFPMVMGAALVGVVDLYCTRSQPADQDFMSTASLLAGRVASAAVHTALHEAEDHRSVETPLAPALRREVHQATGRIMSPVTVSATEAFSRVRGYAFVTGRPIDAIAHDVVDRTLDFTGMHD
jgi:hypothetical protein